DQALLKNADLATRSFVELLEGLTLSGTDAEGALAFIQPAPGLIGTAELTYAFDIAERATTHRADAPDVPDGSLLVTVHGRIPAGIGTPVVLVDPEQYQAVPYPVTEPDTIGYCYKHLQSQD